MKPIRSMELTASIEEIQGHIDTLKTELFTVAVMEELSANDLTPEQINRFLCELRCEVAPCVAMIETELEEMRNCLDRPTCLDRTIEEAHERQEVPF